MIPVLTAAQMRAADQHMIGHVGVPARVLMETAGRAVAELVRKHNPAGGRVVVVCGTGNNGGDGLVAARVLHQWGVPVTTVVVGAAGSFSPETQANLQSLQRAGGVGTQVSESSRVDAALRPHLGAALVVDALFGTGLSRPVDGAAASAIQWINAHPSVLSVDVPSGLHADTGAVLGVAVQARWTLALGARKRAHVIIPGAERCGDVTVADIGIPTPQDGPDVLLGFDAAEAARWYRPRWVGAHKGTEGHVLVVGGHAGMTGAAVMACRGALRAGAGRVSWARDASAPDVGAVLPEVTSDRWEPQQLGVAVKGARVTALVVGPGLRPGSDGEAWVTAALEQPLPCVLDAGALTLLAGGLERLKARRWPTVLTPHPAELARLLGTTTPEVQADRVGAARTASELSGAVVVNKGARSVVAAPDGRTWVGMPGHPVLAVGGSGDVLAGMVGALLASGMGAMEGAALAVAAHALSGEALAEQRGPRGVTPSEVADHLPAVWARLEALR